MTIPPKKTPTKPSGSLFGKIGDRTQGHRVLLYGPGGIGKTTIACQAPGPVAFVDAEDSLPILAENLAKAGIPEPMVLNATDWPTLRESLANAQAWDGVQTIALEITKIEEWCIKHTLATVKNEKGMAVSRIEDYGYGKGYTYVYETFLLLLSDLDRHCRVGGNVILIAHDCVKSVPNPTGDDWIRYEPRLQDPASGKASIRLRTKEWSDHTLFFSYDVAVDKEGKGKGSGTRTIYTAELPHFMAKSRTTNVSIPVLQGTDVWGQIIK